MSKGRLCDQLFAFSMSLSAQRDPAPPSVIDLFNRLLDEARTHKTWGLALDDIPRQIPGAHLSEVAMWAAQLQITFAGEPPPPASVATASTLPNQNPTERNNAMPDHEWLSESDDGKLKLGETPRVGRLAEA